MTENYHDTLWHKQQQFTAISKRIICSTHQLERTITLYKLQISVLKSYLMEDTIKVEFTVG